MGVCRENIRLEKLWQRWSFLLQNLVHIYPVLQHNFLTGLMRYAVGMISEMDKKDYENQIFELQVSRWI